ncbi:uncharacterized protein LOC110989261 isoform X2 [Acanthaster planci]|uniref:Uncharacterized protein LOC110989261 isoform X2 n=1 Tax=Acanthaster planci TaxID=133434 RepID=A0A8B7ZWS6_ACAPL|nr:uncharacterized protein LOC110989261 isoform X2 [Acanthaster planci]
MAVDVSEVFFTEEDYERFSLRPKFDVNLFKAYNPSIEGCTISPVKTRQAQVKNAEASKQGATVQQEKKAPLSNAPKKNVTPGVGEKTPTIVWNLKSPKNHFPYPRYSCMTHAQQQRYIELWQKHGQRHPNQTRYATTPGDIAEKQQLRKLQILVHQEQQEFMKYARHVARCSPKDYKHLPPAAQQYAKDQWLIQDQRVKQLPQHFSVCQTIGIVPAAVFLTDPVLTFSARLLCVVNTEIGKPYIIIVINSFRSS